MSTRSRTKSGVSGRPSTAQARKGRADSQASGGPHDDMQVDLQGGDHESSKISTKISKATNQRKSKGKAGTRRNVLRPIECICTKGDDGSPMIYCGECHIWYHFTCVDMSEPEAEEISIYVCPTCTASTGLRSTMTWEGGHAVEEVIDDEATVLQRQKDALNTGRRAQGRNVLAQESEEGSSSEDEYVDVKREYSEKTGLTDRVQTHLRSLSTASDADSVSDTKTRRQSRAKVSPSPSVSHRSHPNLKRKAPQSSTTQPSPAHKRKRSIEGHGSSAADDPARKYCLGKLEELFRDIYLRYPHIRVPEGDSAETGNMDVTEDGQKPKSDIISKDLESLSDEEKELLLNEARQFANELESCIFDIYSEPDKAGQPHAGGKYKERFRMLQFNLSKVDRVIIHQRITSGNISAKEISLMSSTDLADEETKQSIILAEKEALEHSILLKSTAPRAKITHKGLQDIEDVNGAGEVATAHEIELAKEREQEEDERRERERMSRLRTVQRQRTASTSVPPESPIVQQSPTEQQWGAPPPVPSHAMSPSPSDPDDVHGHGSRQSSFLQTSESNIVEPEFNLADLINIDEEQDTTHNQQPTTGAATNASQPSPVITTPTGISPFAARPERSRGASFDLSSIWNAPKEPLPSVSEPAEKATPTPGPSPPVDEHADGSDKEDAMDLESVEANDQDFDMFLEENQGQTDSPSDLIVTPIPLQEVESLPQVWRGKIAMPLDSTVPQETFLVARQVAGRPIPPDSPLWRTLFPSEQLRIEGRVPVINSSKYLMQMRLNATKELYAAAFIPASSDDTNDFKIFCNFLISKGRHGLVFPWGNRPKDYHPGRELYMIPLLQSEPLPEFVELLDELKLPKTRTKDYLLGIWILNKGKLATLPNATPTPPVQANPSTTQIPTNPSTNAPLFNAPVLPPQRVPQTPPVPAPPVVVPQLPPSIPGLPIQPAALAAEVASLTPEQLQEVLRTLAATTQIPLPPPPPGHIPQAAPPAPQFSQNRPFQPHVPTPPMGSHIPPGLQNAQPWMHPPPTSIPSGQYPISYPPPNVPYQPPPRSSNAPAPGPYDRQDYDRDFRQGPHYSQGGRGPHDDRGGPHDDRGWRGNSNHRGAPSRGRGRGGDGHDRDFNARRSSDSGWPRRSRNENQGGPSW